MQAYSGAKEAHSDDLGFTLRTVEAHSGAQEAHLQDVEAHLESRRLILES